MQADYRAAAQVLDNDGHTLRVRLKNAGALQLGSTRFTLTQFHFHTPGGETLDGEAFPFSAHVLHRGPGGGLLALTDAPCTEGVDWLVLRQPQTLSAAQLAQWQKLFADNMRAPQPLNGRRVGASKG